jgi:pyridoxine kinase
VLSTHTAGFDGFTFRDLTEDMPEIHKHWQKENIKFKAIYTGYLGSVKQVGYVKDILDTMGTDDCVRIVDPAMADNGKLYSLFDMNYVEAMKTLCATADYLLPNITEACFLTGMEYRETYDEAYVNDLMTALHKLGAKTVVLTGVGFHPEQTGVMISEQGVLSYYPHRRLPESCHGTGDVYASAFVGALMKDLDAYTAAKIAADYVLISMENTRGDKDHTYGVKFEPVLGTLMDMIRIARKIAARG